MPSNPFLFACLVVGFLFCQKHKRSRALASELSGPRYVLQIGLYGTLFLLVSRVFCVGAFQTELGRQAYHSLHSVLPIPLAGTSLSAAGIAVAIAAILNKLQTLLDDTLLEHATHLQRLLIASAVDQHTVEVTLETSKVYIGWIHEPPGLEHRDFTLLPIFSGYRDEHQQLIPTTDYLETYEKLGLIAEESPESEVSLVDFIVVIKLEDVVTARRWDKSLYENEFDNPTEELVDRQTESSLSAAPVLAALVLLIVQHFLHPRSD